jgi:hypothetical protein
MIVYTFKFGEGDSFVRRTFCSKTVAERERRNIARRLIGSYHMALERTYWLNEHPLEQKVLKYKHEIVDYMQEIADEHRDSLHERIGRNY